MAKRNTNPEDMIGTALVKEACPLCGALSDGPILMNTIPNKYRADQVKAAHGKVIGYTKEPCDKCQKSMQIGIVIIEIDEEKTNDNRNPFRTGKQYVVTPESITRWAPKEHLQRILEFRATFLSSIVTEQLGLTKIKPLYNSLEEYKNEEE